MLYARNRDSFKKTTERVEHKAAAKHIIQSLRQKLDRQNVNHNIAQSKVKKPPSPLLIYHLFDIQIDSQQKCVQAMRTYIDVLQQELTPCQDHSSTQTDPQPPSPLSHEFKCYLAESKTLLSRLALCLIDCKKNAHGRDIDECLSETDRVLEMYSSMFQEGIARDHTPIYSQQLIEYYEKTIEHLKKNQPFNEVRLLRQNLNACLEQNQVIKSQMQSKEMKWKKQIEVNKNDMSKMNADCLLLTQANLHLSDSIAELRKNNTQLWEDNAKLKESCDLMLEQQKRKSKCKRINTAVQCEIQINQKSNMNGNNKKCNNDDLEWYKLKNEKQYLQEKCAELQEKLQKKEEQLQQIRMVLIEINNDKEVLRESITTYSDQNILLQQRVKLLQSSSKHQQSIIRVNNQSNISVKEKKEAKKTSKKETEQQASIQSLLKMLNKSETKAYYKCLLGAIQAYESKISTLRNNYIDEKAMRDTLMQWGTSLYNSFNTKTLMQFKNIRQRVTMSALDKYLTSIKCLSLGINSQQMENMEQQLKEYVITLQKRMPALEECFEEGSSLNEIQDCSATEIQDFNVFQ